MEREILFRGKRIDNGKWGYGYLYEGFTGTMIIALDGIEPYGCEYAYGVNECFLVDPATVGQFTEIYDCNQKKIFGGDIVESPCGEVGVVEYFKEDAMFIIDFPITQGHSSWTASFGDFDGNEMTVIGNIHDTKGEE